MYKDIYYNGCWGVTANGLIIIKLVNEYYIVHTFGVGFRRFYICDQWEGLEELLKDNRLSEIFKVI